MARPRQYIVTFVCFCVLIIGSMRWNFNSPFTKFNSSPSTIRAKDRFDVIINVTATTIKEHDKPQMKRDMMATSTLLLNGSTATTSDEARKDSSQQTTTTFFGTSNDYPTMDTSPSSSSSSSYFNDTCFALNSKSWLSGSRIGNIQLPDDWIDPMMHPHHFLLHPFTFDKILDQTLCYKMGRFRKVASHWNASDPQQIHDWEFRLLYLALHRYLHLPAHAEYQQRRACGYAVPNHKNDAGTMPSTSSLWSTSSTNNSTTTTPYGHIGNMDYECPNAKYLVTVINGRAGMGAVMKSSVMPSIYMAFVTGRIPLFMQAIQGEGVPEVITHPLMLTSCDRRDWQCIYLPISPCVLTLDDLRNATVLNAVESRNLKQSGKLNNILNQTKVLVSGSFVTIPLHTNFPIHDLIRTKAYEIVGDMLHEWRNHSHSTSQDSLTEQWKVWTAAAESLGAPYLSNTAVSDVRKWRYLRAALFYAMRPNPMARHAIDQQIQAALPNHTDLYYQKQRQYFGLPVRGSDKCKFESTCLPFDTYMQLMMSKLQQHGVPGKRGTIILTSEDPGILPQRHAYTKNTTFPFDFVVNERDIQPGTGKSTYFYDKADAIMISSLVVFKLQLISNVLVGNCCSNFHNLLFELVREGCGADPHMDWECLSTIKDPRFRICCGWTKEGDCKQIWADHHARRSAAFHSASVNKT